MSDVQPNLKQLVEELQPIRAKWQTFGLFLGISNDDLEAIEADKKNVEDKLYALCCQWSQLKPRGTWKDVVKALKKIKRLDIAKRLKEKYIKKITSSDMCTSQSKDSAQRESSPIQHNSVIALPFLTVKNDGSKEILIPKELITELNRLESQFKAFFFEIKHYIKFIKVDIEVLQEFLCDRFQIPYQPIPVIDLDQTDALFEPFIHHLNFLDTDVLHSIDSAYLKGKLKHEINFYDKNIEEFENSTSIIRLTEMIKSRSEEKSSTIVPVILCLGRPWNERNVKNLKCLMKYLFGNNNSLLRLISIHHSVLTIIFTVPRSILLFVITMASRKIRGMKWAGVLSVQIGTVLLKINDNNESDIETSWGLVNPARDSDQRIADDIQFLVNIGCDVNMKDNHGRTPLALAACGNVLTLRVLLQAKVNPNAELIGGLTALHISSELGHYQCVDLLLHFKADPNIQDKDGNTALIFNIQAQHYRCVQRLLQSNADPNIQANNGGTALYMASQNGNDQFVNLLLQSKADPDIQDNGGYTPLNIASEYGHHRCVHLLLQSNTNPNIQAKNGVTALFMASQNGHYQCVNLLLQSKADPDIQDNDGFTALHVASENGHHQCVDKLLRCKANPNIQENSGVTALYSASQNGHHQCVDLLLHSNAHPNNQDKFGATALHIASVRGHIQCVSLLLQSKADPDIQDNDGCTALYGASEKGHYQCVDLLLQSKADPDIQNNDGFTALHAAIYKGHHQCADLLLKSKADPDIKCKNGTTALLLASQNGHYQCVDLLLQSKADPDIQNNKGGTPLSIAILRKHHQIVKLLLKHKANPNLGQQYCPLLVACAVGDLSIVSLLLHYGALVDVPGENLPLLAAVVNDHYDIAKSLITAGAKVNVRNQYGGTPLMIASAYGNIPMVQLLLQSGADVEPQDITAYDIAVAKGHQNIVTLLAFKLHERAQKYLLDSDDQSDMVARPQNDDAQSQSSNTSPQINNDSSEAVSQQYQIGEEHEHSDHLAKDQENEQKSSKETILNRVNSLLSSLQSSYKSLKKNAELMFERQPRIGVQVY